VSQLTRSGCIPLRAKLVAIAAIASKQPPTTPPAVINTALADRIDCKVIDNNAPLTTNRITNGKPTIKEQTVRINIQERKLFSQGKNVNVLIC